MLRKRVFIICLSIGGGLILTLPVLSSGENGQLGADLQDSGAVLMLAKKGGHGENGHPEQESEIHHRKGDQGGEQEIELHKFGHNNDQVQNVEEGKSEPTDDDPGRVDDTPEPDRPIAEPAGSKKYQFKPYLWRPKPQDPPVNQ